MTGDSDIPDDDLTAALRSVGDEEAPDDAHLLHVRQQLLGRTRHANCVPGFRIAGNREGAFPAKTRWRVRTLTAAAAVLLAVCLAIFRPVGSSADAGLSASLIATRQVPWIHARTVVQHHHDTLESESWCSPLHRIVAFRAADLAHYVDYSKGMQFRCDRDNREVVQWRADAGLENYGHAFVNALLQEGDLSEAFPFHHVGGVEKQTIAVGGSHRVQYRFRLELRNQPVVHQETVVVVDPADNRILSWEETHAGGTSIRTEFDYPTEGPRDIYDLGADRNSKVVDRTAGSDVVRLAESLQQAVRQFEDYEALVIDRVEDSGALPGAPLLRRLLRNGAECRMDLVVPRDADFPIPQQIDLTWWRTHRSRLELVPLAVREGRFWKLYPVQAPRLEMATEIVPRVSRMTEIPVAMLPGQDHRDPRIVPIWPSIWPEYACRPLLLPTDPTLQFEFSPETPESDSGAVRLNLLAPDGPFARERARYWLLADEDWCVQKSIVMQPTFNEFPGRLTETQVVTELFDWQRSPRGCAYAAHRKVTAADQAGARHTQFIVDFAFAPASPDQLVPPTDDL